MSSVTGKVPAGTRIIALRVACLDILGTGQARVYISFFRVGRTRVTTRPTEPPCCWV